MNETWVGITDFALALESVALAYFLARRGTTPRRVALYVALASTSALGGIVHVGFPDESTLAFRVLWYLTLLGIGLVSLLLWRVGEELLSPAQAQRAISQLARGTFLVYLAVITFVSRRFFVALVDYLPPALFLAAVLYRRKIWAGVGGIAVTWVAAAVQQVGPGSPVERNTLYHLIQAIGLLLLWQALRDERIKKAPATEAGAGARFKVF